jgi:Ran-binding protein 1
LLVVIPSIVLQEHQGSDKTWVWHAPDFADGEVKEELFCIRFGSVESRYPTACLLYHYGQTFAIFSLCSLSSLDAQTFKKAFEDAQKAVPSNAGEVEELLQALKVDDKEEKKSGKEDKEIATAVNDKEPSSTEEGK